jgi:hypothetical protein
LTKNWATKKRFGEGFILGIFRVKDFIFHFPSLFLAALRAYLQSIIKRFFRILPKLSQNQKPIKTKNRQRKPFALKKVKKK